ncbi:MAG: CoA ester lyase [Pseudomonadota bacterium]
MAETAPRSLLFVPADSERKRDKALDSGADAIILDLEDSVALGEKQRAREIVAEFLVSRPETGPKVYVRVNAFDSGLAEADLAVFSGACPDCVVLPKCRSGADVQKLDALLRVAEAEAGIVDGRTAILPIATETADAVFQLGTYSDAGPRLIGLSWGAEDLSADIAALANRDETGRMTEPFRLVRSLCLFGAVAAGTAPIDTVYVDFRNEEGLIREVEEAARDGFLGKLAIHPAQVAPINQAFTPSDAQIAEAEAVIAAVNDAAGMGVASLNGQMIDRPHVVRAERLLARAQSAKARP